MNDQETFEQAILRSWQEETGGKSFVLFSSPNCVPCGRFKGTLEKIEGIAAHHIGYVNVYHAAAAAVQSNVRSVPTLVRFEQGRETGRLVGERPEGEVWEFLNVP